MDWRNVIDRSQAFERRRLGTQIGKVAWWEWKINDVAVPHITPHQHEPLRIRVRQRPQQHRIDHAEIAVLAPMPSAMVMSAVIANAGFFRSVRAAKPRSFAGPCSLL